MALGALPEYPWEQMAPYIERARQHPGGVVDLSIGSPVDATPESVQNALREATDAHSYPATIGSPDARAAIARWYASRRGVTALSPDEVMETVGSKEFIAWLPFMLGLGEGDVVVHPGAAYPTYAMGAALAGADALASDDPAEWPAETKLVYLNSPGNPDGRVLSIDDLRAAVERARALGAVIVGDECYAELGWEAPWQAAPTPCILDERVVGDRRDGVLSVYSLSKQSNLAGYRAAFVAGDAAILKRLATVRKHAGMMPPAPVQRAMIAALDDEVSVAEQKARYRARRDVLKPALEAWGLRIDRSEAGLYLWGTRGEDAWRTLAELADLGIVAGPGPFYGEHPEHIRVSLTATDERIAAAANRLGA